jgi:hypothetical protein
MERCEAGLTQFNTFEPANGRDHVMEQCWIASAKMIFAWFHHPISDERIRARLFGMAGAWPPFSLQLAASVFSSPFVDDNNVRFISNVRSLGHVEATTLVAALDGNEPILVTNGHHVMVLTAVEYDVDQSEHPTIERVLVQDPWPAEYEGHPGGTRVMESQEVHSLREAWVVTTTP